MDFRDRRNLHVVGELVAQYFPEDIENFNRLQRLEQALDDELVRRQVALKEVQCLVESRIQPLVNQRLFRLHIFHSHENQTGADGEHWSYVSKDLSHQTMAPSWTLRVQGALINQRGLFGKYRFSDFFEKVIITTEDETIVWDKKTMLASEAECDGFELKRSTEREMDVQIVLMLDKRKTELLEIPKELATLTGSQLVTVPQFYRVLCQYVKAHALIFPDDASSFQVDASLAAFFDLPVGSKQLLSILILRMREKFRHNGVFTINHRLRFDEDAAASEQVYDIAVEVTDARLLSESLPQGAEFQQATKMISDLDREISEKMNLLKSHITREAFLRDFAKNPILAMKAILDNPPKALPAEVVTGASWVDHVRELKSSDFYRQPWTVAAAAQLIDIAKKDDDKRR